MTDMTFDREHLLKAFVERYRVVLVATIVSVVIGLLLMIIGESLHDIILLRTIFLEAGKVVLVTSFIGLIFEFVMHDRFVHRVMGEVNRLDHSIDNLQTTLAITAGAIESGLSAVFSERHRALNEIAEMLSTAQEGKEFCVLGISLGDFLCPHGLLYGPILAALNRGVNIRALLLCMNSDAAKTRAEREEGNHSTPNRENSSWEDWYHETRCFDELKTASDVAKSYIKQFKDSKDSNTAPKGKFSGHVYTLSPLCFLVIYEKAMFLESYHYAGRGGEAPILRISKKSRGSDKNTRLFDIYQEHFDVLWSNSVSLHTTVNTPIDNTHVAVEHKECEYL